MCFQDTQEWHQQFCRPVYSLAVIISTISIQNRFREHDKNVSFPAIPFKHSLFHLPSPSSRISWADPLVACLFWSLKMPGPVQFKLQSHIQFIMNTLSGCPVRGLGLKGFEWGERFLTSFILPSSGFFPPVLYHSLGRKNRGGGTWGRHPR